MKLQGDVVLIEWCAETNTVHHIFTIMHKIRFHSPTPDWDYLVTQQLYPINELATVTTHFRSLNPHFWLAPWHTAVIANDRATCSFHPPIIDWEKVNLVSQVYHCQYCKMWYPVTINYSNPTPICKHFQWEWQHGRSKVVRIGGRIKKE